MAVAQYTASMTASRISWDEEARLRNLLLRRYGRSLITWCSQQRTESPVHRIEWDFPVNISAKGVVCVKTVSHPIHVLEYLRLVLKIIQVLVPWLEYLHKKFSSTPTVRLRKRENILQHNHMVPKLADFGLSRLFRPDDGTHVSKFRVFSRHGHLLPEYVLGQRRALLKVTKYRYDSSVSSALSPRTHDSCTVTMLKNDLITARIGASHQPATVRYHSRSPCDAEFSVTTSAIGGIEIKICSRTMHAPKYSSVHHPLIQMVLFARKRTADIFTCPKSMVPKSIIDMVERSCTCAWSNVHETCWVSAKSQPESPKVIRASEFNRMKTIDRSIHPSLPIHFNTSTKKETSMPSKKKETSMLSKKKEASKTVSSPPIFLLDSGASSSVTASATELKLSQAHCAANVATLNMDTAPAAADSVKFGIDSDSSVLAPVTFLHKQLVRNSPEDAGSDEPRTHGTPAMTSLAETTRFPTVNKRTDDEPQHHSDPDSRVAEHGTFKEGNIPEKWIIATGSLHHLSGNRQLFPEDLVAERDGLFVYAADGTPMPVAGRGNVNTENVVLPDVWYIPGLRTNLVSVSQLAELDYSVEFSRAWCLVRSADGTVVGRAHATEGGLYEVDHLTVPLPFQGDGAPSPSQDQRTLE